jgi:hypothetical protein
VDLAAPCSSSHDDNYLVTVKDHETGDVIGTATTNTAGVACVAIPESTGWPKSVDVTATKANCRTLTWNAVAVACGQTVTLTGDAKCGVGYIQYQFTGCYNTAIRNLPVTLTNASTGYSETVQTNNSGQARFYPPAGPGYVVTTSPEGFNPFTSPTWTVGDCAQISQSVTLTVASTHVCCEVQKAFTPWSPYPIKKTLTLTDDQGSTTIPACSGSACVTRSVSDVSSQCGPNTVTCSPNPNIFQPPTIGAGSTSIKYTLNISTTPGSVNFQQDWMGYTATNAYKTACVGGSTFYRIWRCEADCGATFNLSTSPNTTTIHSLHPLLIEFQFTGAWNPGPAASPASINAGPPMTSVVISE